MMDVYNADYRLFKYPVVIRDSKYGLYGDLSINWMTSAFRTGIYLSYYPNLYALGVF